MDWSLNECLSCWVGGWVRVSECVNVNECGCVLGVGVSDFEAVQLSELQS